MIIDRLYESVKNKGNVCVGLDTSPEYIPNCFLKEHDNLEDGLFDFNKRIIDAVSDVCACFKVQIAYYEALGLAGLLAYKRTLKYIKNCGCISIADIKRGDIANTARMYAKAHFTGDFESDFVTLSPYMGFDSLEPYLDYVRDFEKGIFILVRTSNKGAFDIQYMEDKRGIKVYRHVADKVCKIASYYKGKCGYSSIGGVIGCTHVDEDAALRRDFGDMFMLIPGYGAQGGTAGDVAVYLRGGNGGIVNSSRGILLSYKKHEDGEKKFDMYARDEVIEMREAIWNAAGIRNE